MRTIARAFFRGVFVALIGCLFGVLAAVAAHAQNPDGPIGTIMIEPSFSMMGLHDYDAVGWVNSDLRKGDDDDPPDDPPEDPDPRDWHRLALDIRENVRSEVYGLSLLAPIKPQWTLGFSYAYTNLDRKSQSGDFKREDNWDTWTVRFRVRYWWNISGD